MSFRIFISHRFQDASIADALRKQLLGFSIPEKNIFQAGTNRSGLMPGQHINSEIMEVIRDTDLFLLVFTELDEDWSYCMWELGLATGRDTKPTSVVVFRCAESLPHVRAENLAVDVRDPKSVANFVHNLHRNHEFVAPNEQSREAARDFLKVLEETSTETIEERSKKFYSVMMDALPNGEPKEIERVEYIEFVLEYDTVTKLKMLWKQDEPGAQREIQDLVERECVMSIKSSNNAAKRFGLASGKSQASLGNLLSSWRRQYRETRGVSEISEWDLAWTNRLIDDIARATNGSVSQPTSKTMASIELPETRYMPVVVRSREKRDGRCEFDMYLFRVPPRSEPGTRHTNAATGSVIDEIKSAKRNPGDATT